MIVRLIKNRLLSGSGIVGILWRGFLLLAAIIGVLMLMSESEDLTLSRFIAQKVAGVALVAGSRLGYCYSGKNRKQ